MPMGSYHPVHIETGKHACRGYCQLLVTVVVDSDIHLVARSPRRRLGLTQHRY